MLDWKRLGQKTKPLLRPLFRSRAKEDNDRMNPSNNNICVAPCAGLRRWPSHGCQVAVLWVAATVTSRANTTADKPSVLESLPEMTLGGPHVAHRRHTRYRGPGNRLRGTPERLQPSPAQRGGRQQCRGKKAALRESVKHTNHGRYRDTYLTANPLCEGVSSSSFRNIPENQKETHLWVTFSL